jgi:site-specific DNA-methyltransferase (adenine-specific)
MTDQIIHGDCIQELAKLDEGSVDLVFADPPFNIGYGYDEYRDKQSHGDYLSWSHWWISEVVRVLKPHGTFWLAIGDDYAADLKVACTRDPSLKLTCRNWVIWHYTFGVNCKRKFTRSHTHLLYFVKDPKNFTFNADAIRVPSARQLAGDKRADPRGRIPDDTWQFPRVCGTHNERQGFHGCQMPEQVLGRIIRACSNEGDLVLDPFVGSGTTLVVAKKLQRRYLGIELSGQYVAGARARLVGIKPGYRILGSPDSA